MISPEYRQHYKKTFLLAYPVCISQMGHVMVGVADTAMVGQIGTIEQAAVSLANTLYILVLVFAIGVSYGITPMVAAADSKKDYAGISGLLKNGFAVNILLSVILFLILYVSSPLLSHLDQPKNVVSFAIPFFNVMIFSMIPLGIFITLKQFAEGLSFTKAAMVISIGANLLNILLNYILIFGKWGFHAMGLMGSCWATFLSRCVMAIVMLAYIYYGKDFKKYRLGFEFKNFSKPIIKQILTIGLPSGLQFIFEVGAFSFAVIMIGWISPSAMAAHQIAISFAALTYMVASGISSAATVRVGNYFGLKDIVNIRKAGLSSFFMVICFMVLSAIFFICMSDRLPILFSRDKEVWTIASSLLVIAAFFQLSDGLQVTGLGALRGLNDVNVPTFITLISYWIIGLPTGYILGFKAGYGVQGIWFGLLTGLSIAALLLYFRFEYVTRKMKFIRV